MIPSRPACASCSTSRTASRSCSRGRRSVLVSWGTRKREASTSAAGRQCEDGREGETEQLRVGIEHEQRDEAELPSAGSQRAGRARGARPRRALRSCVGKGRASGSRSPRSRSAPRRQSTNTTSACQARLTTPLVSLGALSEQPGDQQQRRRGQQPGDHPLRDRADPSDPPASAVFGVLGALYVACDRVDLRV